ncbi:PAS domain-containing protein [Mucilaginibacter sp. SP1R1]|uniref:PAS domain-containing protein n=1 Tax=Mucilaginibacter sp. SP1R1 TaxID=2723091 RepID=UPI00160B59E6|nr:PAS domain-containing protein [Mucilaginibacter sp. SP1R1]MBB6152011.1 PAS domain-containing protein [Mucilaginibacter sp. SP1R1]
MNFYFVKRKDKIGKAAVLPYNIDFSKILSGSSSAIAIYATEDFCIEYANDAMLAYWNKDRRVLNKSISEALPNLKYMPLLGLLETVWDNGVTLNNNHVANTLLVNGVQQTLYFDSEYKAVKDADDEMLYILQITTDVTESYLNNKKLVDINKSLTANLVEVKEELIATGSELELAYVNADRLSTRLLEALDYLSVKIELKDIGFWSVDLETQELTFSNNGMAMHGIKNEIKLTLADGLKIAAEEYQEEIARVMEDAIKNGVSYIKEFKINPLDGSKPRWLKASGSIVYNNKGEASTLSGNIVITND